MLRWIVLSLGVLSSFCFAADTPFETAYKEWIDPENHFIDFFDDQARVVFIGSAAMIDPNKSGPPGTRPTVSEGMGYGLLLSYAADDQATFDKFVRYILGIANNQGCSVFDGTSCLSPCPFLMPWVVNDQGLPFWFLPNPGSPSYFSSGSASDADFQMAWALYLASLKVGNGWANSTFSTSSGKMNYKDLFNTMALQIRLNDVDLKTLRYNPGNQWGKAGTEVLYPGYFTPQAFFALDKAPLPNVSKSCPTPFPTHSPSNSLQLVFKNNVAKTVSIDYLGGNSTISELINFVPKPNTPNGYTVAPLTEATAIFDAKDDYPNATIKATFYNENGEGIYKSYYMMEYQNNSWVVTDVGSTPEGSYCQEETAVFQQSTIVNQGGNVVYVYLTQPGIKRLTFKFARVLSKSLRAVRHFNKHYKTGLMPNVIHYDHSYPDEWSQSFAYDSCRFALWSADFLQFNPVGLRAKKIKTSLKLLLSEQAGVANFIQNGTLPSGGINALNSEPIGNWDSPAIPLNACLMTAASVLENKQIYDQLSPSVFNYSLPDNQPKIDDPVGDSGPYYNAVTKLLSLAILEKRFAAVKRETIQSIILKRMNGKKTIKRKLNRDLFF